MQVSVEGVRFRTRPRRTRLPFRFGAVTLTETRSIRCELELRTEDGRSATGFSGDLLVPKWFSKNAGSSAAQDQEELIESARRAAEAMRAARPATAFELWWGCYAPGVQGVEPSEPGLLVRGFGYSLVERALLDACCRAAGLDFFAALKQGLFGFDAGRVHPDCAGRDLALALGPEATGSMRVRHTVGMRDALRVDEIPAEARVEDGLPQALEEDIAAYGLESFKLKIGQGAEADAARLLAIHELLEERVPGYRCTVDGNEQYESIAELARVFALLRASEAGRGMLERLQCIEQPLHRAATFDPARNVGIEALSEDVAPVILDEADGCPQAFARAIELGYRGISVKNCKGVFRALASRALCQLRSTEARAIFQSGEDLTNLPVLPLQQDLCTALALGLPDVERNGHHYFRGLDHLEPEQARAAAAAHEDLYEPLGEDGFRLRIRDGRLRTSSLRCAGYGYRDGVVRPDSADG